MDKTPFPQSQRGVAVVFKKTIGMSPVKTRLAARMGKKNAEAFYRLSLLAVEDTLVRVQEASSTELDLKYAVAEKAAMGLAVREEFSQISQGEGTLGQRLSHVYGQLADAYDYVLFLGGDCPQIPAAEVDLGIDSLLLAPGFVLGPAEDGGFWMWGGSKKFPRELWSRPEYSVSSTLRQLEGELASYARCKRLAAFRDGDELDDLMVISQALAELKDPTRSQSALLSWLQQHI